MTTKHYFRKKRYSYPHPKKIPPGLYILYTSKNFSKFRGFNESFAGEAICAPWIQLSSFPAFSGKGGNGAMCRFCVSNVLKIAGRRAERESSACLSLPDLQETCSLELHNNIVQHLPLQFKC